MTEPLTVTICTNCDHLDWDAYPPGVCMASPRFWLFQYDTGVWTHIFWHCRKINTRGRCVRYQSDQVPVELTWIDTIRWWLS